VLLRLVDTRFQGLFTPLAGVLFAFPSWYWFTIGHQVVFSLGRWSSQIPTGLLEPRGTQEPLRRLDPFAYRAVTCCGPPFQTVQLGSSFVTSWDSAEFPERSYNTERTTPAGLHTFGLGCSPFARRYLENLG
jgi:hypothetical protein